MGANQRREAFDQRVHKEFLSFLPPGVNGEETSRWLSRSARAVGKQYKTIRAACIKMYSKVEMVRAADLSGEPTDDDVWRIALLLYNGEGFLSDAYMVMNDKSYNIGPKFPHEASYKYLDEANVLSCGAVCESARKSRNKEMVVAHDAGDEDSGFDQAGEGLFTAGREEKVGEYEREGRRKTQNQQRNADDVKEGRIKRPMGNKKAKSKTTREAALIQMANSYATIAASGKGLWSITSTRWRCFRNQKQIPRFDLDS